MVVLYSCLRFFLTTMNLSAFTLFNAKCAPTWQICFESKWKDVHVAE